MSAEKTLGLAAQNISKSIFLLHLMSAKKRATRAWILEAISYLDDASRELQTLISDSDE